MDVMQIYLVVISVVTFLVYGMDKWKAQKGKRRISEKALLVLAVLGGSVGAYCGMWFFRHKTRKPKFYLGVPLIFLAQVLLVYGVVVCF